MSIQTTPEVLTILEVTQKQAYIFGDKHLMENVKRSSLIEVVTSPRFFKSIPDSGYQPDNLVYAGGGHTILQFDSADSARHFVQAVTRKAYLDHGIELFAKTIPYRTDQTPGQNMKALIQALEKKKSLRLLAFRQHGIGLEKEKERTIPMPNIPEEEPETEKAKKRKAEESLKQLEFPTEIKTLCGKDNFFAVVHIDGNGMGAKSQAVTEKAGNDWNSCCEKHRAFSDDVDHSFKKALRSVVELVDYHRWYGTFEKLGFDSQSEIVPIRPLICAGDDVTFLVPASIALECAASYLRTLDEQTDGRYSACAGIAMVHQKYPFHRAYQLAEHLCDSAKRYAAELAEKADNNQERIATMDWHMEFGQGKSTLGAIREDYLTDESGNGTKEAPVSTMTLRPLCVNGFYETPYRTYDFFIRLFELLTKEKYPRSKVKGLRETLKKSEEQIQVYLRKNQIQKLAKLGMQAEREDAVRYVYEQGKILAAVSTTCEERAEEHQTQFVRRRLYFDVIELMDRMILLRKEEEA